MEQFGQLSAESVNHRQIEGTKVPIERHVRQIIVNVEEEGILDVLRWLLIGNPVELIFDNLDWFAVWSRGNLWCLLTAAVLALGARVLII